MPKSFVSSLGISTGSSAASVMINHRFGHPLVFEGFLCFWMRVRRLRPVTLRLSADSVDSCVYSVVLPISEDSLGADRVSIRTEGSAEH
jgi:hypothetical protein